MNSKANLSFDPGKCIICQESKDLKTTSTPDGRIKILRAAEIRKDIVYERLKLIEENFHYHVDNRCYKSYTMKKTLDKLEKTIKNNNHETVENELEQPIDSEEPARKRTRYELYH